MIRWLTAGESHGPALSAILEGMPGHIEITKEMIDKDLSRRRLGFGRGARQNFEADVVTILGGVRHGLSQGGPIAIEIANSEWPKWSKVMAPEIVAATELAELARNAPLMMQDQFWKEQALEKPRRELPLELLLELF